MKSWLFISILLVSGKCFADSKLSALIQDTTAQSTDLIYKVDNPSGTPISRSMALGNLFNQLVNNTPQLNYAVLWNGTEPVWAAQGTSFTFGIASFSDAQAATIEEGVGIWESTAAITFTASYSNGPPIGSTITFSGWSALPLSTPFTSTMNVQNVNFPAVAGTVVFTLSAQNATTSASASITHHFNNDKFYGTSTLSSGWSSAQILAFGQNDLVNSIPTTFTTNPGAGQYITWASPTRLGTVSFTCGGFLGGFNSPSTISVTNASGYTENYYAYSSANANLGSTTCVTSTP